MSLVILGKRKAEDDGEAQAKNCPKLNSPDADMDEDDEDDDVHFVMDQEVASDDTHDLQAGAGNNTHIDDEHNPRGVILWIRVTFNGRYSTAPFAAPAHHASRLDQIFELVHEKLPSITLANEFNEDLLNHPAVLTCQPLVLMQEAGRNGFDIKVTQWQTTQLHKNEKTYFRWYVRNVHGGREGHLGMEVRLRTNGTRENVDLIRDAGRGFKRLEDAGYRSLERDARNVPHLGTFWDKVNSREHITQPSELLTEPGLHNYFPKRHNKRLGWILGEQEGIGADQMEISDNPQFSDGQEAFAADGEPGSAMDID